jgi:hypothetical protein
MLFLLELMGASEWFENQVQLAQTKEGIPEKSARTGVLDELLLHNLARQNRAILKSLLSRGNKLRTELVGKLGLGILLLPQTW